MKADGDADTGAADDARMQWCDMYRLETDYGCGEN